MSDPDTVLDDKDDEVTLLGNKNGLWGAPENDCGNSESLILEDENGTGVV